MTKRPCRVREHLGAEATRRVQVQAVEVLDFDAHAASFGVVVHLLESPKCVCPFNRFRVERDVDALAARHVIVVPARPVAVRRAGGLPVFGSLPIR